MRSALKKEREKNLLIYKIRGSTLGAAVIVVGNGQDKFISNPGQGCSLFYANNVGNGINSILWVYNKTD